MKYTAKKVTIEAREIGYVGSVTVDEIQVGFIDGSTASVKKEQCGAHTPAPGDFYITRSDGDNYLCPAKVFHEKYMEASAPEKSALQKSDDEAAAVQKTPNRVTLASIEDKVIAVEYFSPKIAPHFTIAVMTMRNGFIVLGQSAPADPANFDEALGRKFAREDAIRKVWALEGYLLCDRLAIDADLRSRIGS